MEDGKEEQGSESVMTIAERSLWQAGPLFVALAFRLPRTDRLLRKGCKGVSREGIF